MPAAEPEAVWTVAVAYLVFAGFTVWALIRGRVWRGIFPNAIFDRRNAPLVYWTVIGARLLLLAAAGLMLFGAPPA